MSKSAPAQSSAPARLADSAEVRQSLVGKHVCPFCGVMRADPAQPCPRCTLDDNAATRGATKQRIGPWFVLQARNPSAPGMKLATLQALVRKGHLTPRSVVRGPTTDQMWAFAANVRGLSREFGLCFHCGEAVDPSASQCPHCGRGQTMPADTDALLDTGAPASALPAPTPPALSQPPVAPPDFLSGLSANRSDTGMDGGTSLDLQADSSYPLLPALDTRPQLPAAPARPANLQRAPSPAAKEESILTARELAAAFSLDFKPTGVRSQQPRRPVRTLAALLLIVVIAGTIVLALRPDWRQTSFAWATERWSLLAASLERPAQSPDASATAGTTPKATPPAGPPPAVARPTVRETPRPDVAQPTPQAAPAPAPLTPPAPSPVPTPSVVPESRPTPPPPVVIAPVPQPVPEPMPVPTPPLTPVPDDLTVDQATVLAGELRLKAIDAQARNDWAGALRYYEQIQQMPRDAWPADLPLRLDVAKRRAANP